MRTLQTILQEGKTILKNHNIVDGELDAWYLLSYVFHINRAKYLMNPNCEVTDELYHEFLKVIQLRSSGIPLQYITKEQEFMGLSFRVSKDVLIPRQDTEILVEEVLKVSDGKSVLDLCTGSGCIIISIAKLGSVKKAVGSDISEDALQIAKDNAKTLKTEVAFVKSDIYSNIKDTFDIIVSNPPYIPTKEIQGLMTEVKDHEPFIALDGKEDGLYYYRQIIKNCNQYLNRNGSIFLEIGCNQGVDVSELLSKESFTDIKVIKDYAGLDRVVSGKRTII